MKDSTSMAMTTCLWKRCKEGTEAQDKEKEPTEKESKIFESISKRVRSNHHLYNEIQEPTALCLAINQKYDVQVWWMLNHLTYNGQEFVIKSTDKEWITFKHTFNTYTPGSVRVEIVEKNTEVDRWLYERGGIDLFWIKTLDLEKHYQPHLKPYLFTRC